MKGLGHDNEHGPYAAAFAASILLSQGVSATMLLSLAGARCIMQKGLQVAALGGEDIGAGAFRTPSVGFRMNAHNRKSHVGLKSALNSAKYSLTPLSRALFFLVLSGHYSSLPHENLG